jgi:hypothetical protein
MEVRRFDKRSHTVLSTRLFIWNRKEENEIILKFYSSLKSSITLVDIVFFFCGFGKTPSFKE